MTTNAAKANRNADIVDRLEAENARLRAALQYVLDDEPNLMPRATSSCRAYIRAVLEQPTNLRTGSRTETDHPR